MKFWKIRNSRWSIELSFFLFLFNAGNARSQFRIFGEYEYVCVRLDAIFVACFIDRGCGDNRLFITLGCMDRFELELFVSEAEVREGGS